MGLWGHSMNPHSRSCLRLSIVVAGLLGCGDASHVDSAPLLPSGDGGFVSSDGTPAGGSDAGALDGSSVVPSSDSLVVTTDKGRIRGKRAGTGFAFLGIPYAKPPIGARRLMPPVAADPWSDVKDATSFGRMCVQSALELNHSEVKGQEDCLTINVWTPALPSSTKAPLPVLFWKHGGFFIRGSSSQASADGSLLYDGQALANANNAVVVTFNYRIGVLGFLAHPALAAANPQHTTGNYALLDTLLALRWVQANIASFNGDKSRVMLFGESAGATDTCALVSSPLAKGLFASALMQSGNCSSETLAYRYEDHTSIVDDLKCAKAPDVVACLRDAPLSELVKAGGNKVAGKMLLTHTINVDPVRFMKVPFGATVDGYVLEDDPLATIQAGKHNHVPLVVGTNSQELTWLLPHSLVPAIPVVSCVEFWALVNVMFPGATYPGLPAKLIDTYPCKPLDAEAGYQALVALTSDAFFTCPSRRALRAAARTQSEPVYRYFYTHTHSSGTWAPLGAAHAGELAFVWAGFGYFGMTPTAAETKLSQQMQAYWTNFAASSSPNGNALPLWKAYDPTVDNTLQLGTSINELTAVNAKGCDLWDTLQ